MCDYHVYCKINSKWSLKFMKLGVHTVGGMQVCGGGGIPPALSVFSMFRWFCEHMYISFDEKWKKWNE